jgi:translation elongation factor P/translation initiation factor 5A
MAAGTTSDLRNGIVIRYNNDLYQVTEFQHVAPGKLARLCAHEAEESDDRQGH